MKKAKLICLLTGIVLFLIFLFQNTEVITLQIFFWEVKMSQIILIPLVLAIGVGIGYLLGRFPWRPWGRKKGTEPKEEQGPGRL